MVHFGERGVAFWRKGVCFGERGGAFWREGVHFGEREGGCFGERGYILEREGVCFGERGCISERGYIHFGERGVCFRERGLYPRLNQSEDERSQTRSGNESTCCASRAWMASTSSMSLTWAACIVREVIDILLRFQDGREIPEDLLDGAVMKLELAYRELVGLDIVGGLCLEQQQACESVRVAVANLRDIGDRNYAVSEYVPCVCEGGGVGRPRFDIPREQLEALIETHFTAPQMAGMLGVSVRTVRRRMSEFNLSIRSQYAELTDSELDRIVVEIHQQFPTCGNRQLQGYLVSRGLRVQQNRIKEAQRRIDPEGSIMRRLSVMHRRSYNVPAPRSLYHIDGNHKLIR